MTPTARTLQRLRKEGWTAGVVERFNHHTMRRHDLFGCIDLLAVRGDETLGVQATSGPNAASRAHKALEEPQLVEWLAGGVRRFEVWGWRKLKVKRGGKAVRWEPNIVAVELDGDEPPRCVVTVRG